MDNADRARFSIYGAAIMQAIIIMTLDMCNQSLWMILGSLVLFIPVLVLFRALLEWVLPTANSEKQHIAYWVDDAELHINTHGPIIGTFQGAPIYEWVEIPKQKTGEMIRCYYNRTVNLEGGQDIPVPEGVWFFFIEPGILYLAEPENA
jgi:hypothetical protein